MRSDNYLWEKIVLPAYREMFKKSTPSVDLDTLIESGVTKKPEWYRDYVLDDEVFKEILERTLKKCKGKSERSKVMFELYLGSSPLTKEVGGKHGNNKKQGKVQAVQKSHRIKE